MTSRPIADTVVDRCRSTNDLARELGEAGAPHGSWISAREQESGRGRLGREWKSLEGNLFLSMVARLENRARWTWVPLGAALAAARYLDSRFSELKGRVRIKWPNDLWLVPSAAPPGASGAKLGGVLCEAVGSREGSFIVIGLGLNCRTAPAGLDQDTTSISDGLGRAVDADEVRHGVVEALRQMLAGLETAGPAALEREYSARAALPAGVSIEWVVRAEHEGATKASGEVVGLGPSGELRVTTGNSEKSLFAEDVRISLARRASDGSPA